MSTFVRFVFLPSEQAECHAYNSSSPLRQLVLDCHGLQLLVDSCVLVEPYTSSARFVLFFALLAPHLAEKKRDLMSLLTPRACAGVHVVRVEAHDSNALLS